MGVVLMSKRELNRIDVLARLDAGRLTTMAAADLMRVTVRQTHRLLKRYRNGGAPAIANRRRGGRRTTACLMACVITPSRWSGSTTRTLVGRWPPRIWASVMRCA